MVVVMITVSWAVVRVMAEIYHCLLSSCSDLTTARLSPLSTGKSYDIFTSTVQSVGMFPVLRQWNDISLVSVGVTIALWYYVTSHHSHAAAVSHILHYPLYLPCQPRHPLSTDPDLILQGRLNAK